MPIELVMATYRSNNTFASTLEENVVVQEAASGLKSVEKFTRLQISPPNPDRNSSMELNTDCKNRGGYRRAQIQAGDFSPRLDPDQPHPVQASPTGSATPDSDLTQLVPIWRSETILCL